jgi:hypothetical protein
MKFVCGTPLITNIPITSQTVKLQLYIQNICIKIMTKIPCKKDPFLK